METVDIDPDGDVVLVCGGEGQQKGLRVHSVILSRASPVFKALLSPRFSEGAELSSRGKAEVALPEDDSGALEIVCLVLHHRNEEKVFGISLDVLGTIAWLADKYDLFDALHPASYVWVSQLERLKNIDNRQTLLMAAYLFRHSQIFEDIGKDIVWDARVIDTDEGKLIPATASVSKDIFRALEKQRQNAIFHVTRSVDGTLKTESQLRETLGTKCAQGCTYVEKRFLWIASRLREAGLWPGTELEKMSLGRILDALENTGLKEGSNLDGQTAMPHCNKGVRSSICAYSRSVAFSILHECFCGLAEDIREGVMLPCYECVRQGKVLDRRCSHKKDTEKKKKDTKK